MAPQSTLRAVAHTKHEQVHSVSPDERVSDVVQKMKARNIGAMIVIGEDGQVVGIFSERDLLVRVVGDNRDPRATTIVDVMTPNPVCVEASMTVDDAIREVTEKRIRHLPLVTGGKLEHVISSGDLMAWLVHSQQIEIASLTKKLTDAANKHRAILAVIVIFAVLALIAVLTT